MVHAVSRLIGHQPLSDYQLTVVGGRQWRSYTRAYPGMPLGEGGITCAVVLVKAV